MLDRSGREQFHHLTEHVRVALQVPVAIISIVDEDRQVFAGHCGLPSPWDSRGETPMTHSFCQHVVEREQPLEVVDANLHELVSTNHAIADLGVRAYLGVPIALPTGELVGALAAIDTVPRVWTEHDRRVLESLALVVEREIAVGVSELKYRRLFEDMQEGYYIAEAVRTDAGEVADIRFEEVNPAFERLVDLSPDAILGQRLGELMPDLNREMLPAFRTVLETGQSLLHVNSEKAGGRWFENRIRPLGGDRIASVFTDVTERKQNEEQQRVLQQEMVHRVKNIMAVISAVVAASLRNAPSLEDAGEIVSARIQAMARAQALITQQGGDTDFAEIVREAIDPHIGDEGKISIEGPSIVISAQQAVGLSLAIYELATNAAKYGALSSIAGRVAIRWTAGPDRTFDFDWIESHGPAVIPPSSAGFGSKLTDRVVPSYFEGMGKTHYLPEGVRYHLQGVTRTNSTDEPSSDG
ncbi:HWE histidine kinase domain-containing protein [Devosia lucknowensis]|uniref:HWE histidine kinase domain-containing protein n=1 Tax=Devosia lucknowensis TaxID=1096929 RepID=UPI0014830911|nr:HWE histidine kinase domain-containing protein [Devosia lucknowensis]